MCFAMKHYDLRLVNLFRRQELRGKISMYYILQNVQ